MSDDLPDKLLAEQREFVTKMLNALAERDPGIAQQLRALALAGVTEFTGITSKNEGNVWRHEVHAVMGEKRIMIQLTTTMGMTLESLESSQETSQSPSTLH